MEVTCNTMLVILLFTFLPYKLMGLSCGREKACQDLFNITSPLIPWTTGDADLMFNYTDVNYSLLARLFKQCQPSYYLDIEIDCSDFLTDNIAHYYYIVIIPGEPSVIKVRVERRLPIFIINRLETADTTSTPQLQQSQIEEVPAADFMNLSRQAVPSQLWLNLTNIIIQGFCTLLLILTAALTCIGRKDEPAFRHLHFVLSLSLAGVLCSHFIWHLDVPFSVAHLLLSIAEHYLWFVSCLASLTLNTKCCNVIYPNSQNLSAQKKDKLYFHALRSSMTDSLADQYMIIFVIPILYMAPLPFVECFVIHKYKSFRMVPLLTHIYTEGHNSWYTILTFICPFSLIMIINLIIMAKKINGGLNCKGIITSMLPLLVNTTLPIFYLSMMKSRSSYDSFIWDVLILTLTILLTVSVITLFLVRLTNIIDCKRKTSIGSPVPATTRRYNSRKTDEFPYSGLSFRRTHAA